LIICFANVLAIEVDCSEVTLQLLKTKKREKNTIIEIPPYQNIEIDLQITSQSIFVCV
jgi:hypothetical protein